MTAIHKVCTIVKKCLKSIGHTDAAYIIQMEITWSLTYVHAQEIIYSKIILRYNWKELAKKTCIANSATEHNHTRLFAQNGYTL